MAKFNKEKAVEELQHQLLKLKEEIGIRAKKAETQFQDIKSRIQKIDIHSQSEAIKTHIAKLKGLKAEVLEETERLRAQALKGLNQLGTQIKNLTEEERKRRRGRSGSQGA